MKKSPKPTTPSTVKTVAPKQLAQIQGGANSIRIRAGAGGGG